LPMFCCWEPFWSWMPRWPMLPHALPSPSSLSLKHCCLVARQHLLQAREFTLHLHIEPTTDRLITQPSAVPFMISTAVPLSLVVPCPGLNAPQPRVQA
jgi:hypothetical protein